VDALVNVDRRGFLAKAVSGADLTREIRDVLDNRRGDRLHSRAGEGDGDRPERRIAAAE
jgi:hypothetical protein